MRGRTLPKMRPLVGSLTALALAIAACGDQKSNQRTEISDRNVVTNDNPAIERQIGDEHEQFTVVGPSAWAEKVAVGAVKSTESPAGKSLLQELSSRNLTDDEKPAATVRIVPDNLLIGYPVRLLGQGQIFGGVITKVSDRESETLGRLKLIELDPLHVRTLVAQDGQENYFVSLMGCVSACNELSAQIPLISIPIAGISERSNELFLDVSALGAELSLIGLLDPNGDYTGLREVKSAATWVDFSSSTLVFDVETEMVPRESEPGDPEAPRTILTTRWYLKLESGLNSAFVSRPETEGVGFFTTYRGAETKITRLPLTSFNGNAPVHYFIKNVPAEFKDDFSKAFDAWNEAMAEIAGRTLVSYEHVAADDPRASLIVTGDVRYNVLEWDIDNNAPYGGLGPSIASQMTGEIFSANTLVQGPRIVEIYKNWFQIKDEIDSLRAAGQASAAEALLVRERRRVNAMLERMAATPRFEARLGRLELKVPSQMKELEDPIMNRMDFYDTPEGETYESYMKGYWHELVVHELGHNLGLRHNFRGNLGADDHNGIVSSSVMEYLGRPYRHKNGVGAYDRMAIAYGYFGIAPERLDMFCTDEHVVSAQEPTLSAECSRDDATVDPFKNLENLLKRALDLVVGRGLKAAPEWEARDVSGEVSRAVSGLAFYATSVGSTGHQWTNFAVQNGRTVRPTEVEAVKAYVNAQLTAKLCDPSLAVEIRRKETAEGRAKAVANLDEVRDQANRILTQLSLENVSCE